MALPGPVRAMTPGVPLTRGSTCAGGFPAGGRPRTPNNHAPRGQGRRNCRHSSTIRPPAAATTRTAKPAPTRGSPPRLRTGRDSADALGFITRPGEWMQTRYERGRLMVKPCSSTARTSRAEPVAEHREGAQLVAAEAGTSPPAGSRAVRRPPSRRRRRPRRPGRGQLFQYGTQSPARALPSSFACWASCHQRRHRWAVGVAAHLAPPLQAADDARARSWYSTVLCSGPGHQSHGDWDRRDCQRHGRDQATSTQIGQVRSGARPVLGTGGCPRRAGTRRVGQLAI